MSPKTLLLALVAILSLPSTKGIVNPEEQTANIVIYMRKPNEIGPTSWNAGVECLDTFSKIYLHTKEKFTRSYNLVLTSAVNLSTPAAQIQDGFIKLINEAVSQKVVTRELFQLRVVSDAHEYRAYKNFYGELLLADFYVIVIDSLSRLRKLMTSYVSHMRSWNPGARFLVLYHHAEKRNQERVIANAIFVEMLNVYFVNRVGVLYATNMTSYSFWTMDYYNSEACRTTRLRRIGECHNGRAYPDFQTVNDSMVTYFKSVNLENCTFNMCTTIAAPFVEADCVTGIELRIIGIIKNRLRFAINQTCEIEARGVVEQNGSWTGLLGKLNERYCDFILGGFFPDNEVLENFWVSDCYLQDSYAWFVKLADPRPPWKALYSIFHNHTWLCFIVVYVITWIFWYFFMNMLPEPQDFKEFSLAAINAIGVTICSSVNERPFCNASRVFFMALTLYGLNTVTIYTSNLISVFTNPGYLHQIDNIDEVVEAGIPFGGNEENRDWFENEDDMWIHDMYNDSLDFEPHYVNLEAVKRGERAILSSRMFIQQNNISDDIFAFPTNVFSSPLQIIMKPGFPFLMEINWKIRYMRESGFFAKIAKDFHYNNTILNRIAKMRPDFQEEAIVLTTEHLQGPFAILIVGSSCGTIFFIGELLVFWCWTPLAKRYFDSDSEEQKTKKSKKPLEHKADSIKTHKRKVRQPETRQIRQKNIFGTTEENKPQFGIRTQTQKHANTDEDVPTFYFNERRFTPVKRRLNSKKDFIN